MLAGTSGTPADHTIAASASSTEAMTPLCFDLNSLQLSAASAQPERSAMAMPSDDGTADADQRRPESTEESTPALTSEQRGWDRSLLESPGQILKAAMCTCSCMHASNVNCDMFAQCLTHMSGQRELVKLFQACIFCVYVCKMHMSKPLDHNILY